MSGVSLERTGNSKWYMKNTYENSDAAGAAAYVKFLANLISDEEENDGEDLAAVLC